MFFSFDGIDGVGKSTQMDLFCQWLEEQGHEVVTCRDPGSTPLGEKIRDILLNSGEDTPISMRSEMLLYMAARAQLVEQVIKPTLTSGKTIVSDRYLLANVVYQGHAGGLEIEAIRSVGAVTIDGVQPDGTFLLDMPPKDAFKRMGKNLDRVESRGDAFREKLRDGFLKEAEMNSDIYVLDAARPVDVIQSELREIAARILK